MKKLCLLLIIYFCAYRVEAQSDSTKKFMVSGFQLDLLLIGGPISNDIDQQGYQKFVKNNTILNSDLNGYSSSLFSGSSQTSLNSFLSMKLLIAVKTKKKTQKEIVIGLRYGQQTASYLYYYKSKYDTVGTYINSANNAILTNVKESHMSYNFNINCAKLIVPMGLQLTTNKLRRLWFTAGFELAPAIAFNYIFNAYYSEYSTNLYLAPNEPIKNQTGYFSGNSGMPYFVHSSKKISGIGFSTYASIPLAVNFRLSKKINFLKNLNLVATFSPGWLYSVNKFTKSDSQLALNMGFGLRYNLKN